MSDLDEAGSSSDAELMARLASGDTAALGFVYERHRNAVMSVLYRQCPQLPTADLPDLCQEVFMLAMRAAPKYRESGKLRGWLCGLALGHARNQRRKVVGRRSLMKVFVQGRESERDAVAKGTADARIDVRKALAQLPQPQREVLVLNVVEQMTAEEIGKRLGIKPKTVWTRLHRARAKLRTILEAQQ